MLPDDILTLVYSRVASADNRVRFAAVCTSWRAIAQMQPPRRVLPWLILDPGSNDGAKHAYCLEDGTILSRFRFPSEVVGGCIVGCYDGGWVAVSEAPLRIINLFSGAEVALSAKQRSVIRLCPHADDRFVPMKVIFSERPTSRDCILAAIIGCSEVAICGLGRSKSAWLPNIFPGQTVMDIAFCNGYLYCLMSETMAMVRFKIGLAKHGLSRRDPQWLIIHDQGYWYAANGDPNEHAAYIVELRGKIMIAVRKTRGSWWWSRNKTLPIFFCLELVYAGDGTYHWEPLKRLGDHALFLGPTFSKALHVSIGEHCSPRRNHIYYSDHRCYPRKKCLPNDAKKFLTSSNSDGCHAYYKQGESVDNTDAGIMSVGYYVLGGNQCPPMWLFPPDL
ncbi:hypothetical protein CFC21_044878 [Triticum aestivum]|uniref:DUF295 domain-containing protein n=3 Tax=Triticum aestivum TaxID=4565 RepID=A0A9R1JY50_WHEAT|nr:hypothetical protein CFC21_044878 [Triticum aestivum]